MNTKSLWGLLVGLLFAQVALAQESEQTDAKSNVAVFNMAPIAYNALSLEYDRRLSVPMLWLQVAPAVYGSDTKNNLYHRMRGAGAGLGLKLFDPKGQLDQGGFLFLRLEYTQLHFWYEGKFYENDTWQGYPVLKHRFGEVHQTTHRGRVVLAVGDQFVVGTVVGSIRLGAAYQHSWNHSDRIMAGLRATDTMLEPAYTGFVYHIALTFGVGW